MTKKMKLLMRLPVEQEAVTPCCPYGNRSHEPRNPDANVAANS